MTTPGPATTAHLFPTRVPSVDLERRGVRRLRLLSAVMALGFLAAWMISLIVAGGFRHEFTYPSQWVPPTMVVVASVAMFVLARSTWIAPARLLTVGLIYQVVVSYGMVGTQYLDSFVHFSPEAINRDVTGVSTVVIWIFSYSVLVPAPPSRVLVALLASASAVPLTYLGSQLAGDAPPVPADEFFLTFVLPYVFTVAAAYVSARVIHRLGQEARAARELGSYRLETLLGRGGMGEVWRASHRMLARPAAVKLIRREALLGEGPGTDVLARFEREAQVTAMLQSPHTVQLYDYGVAEGGTLFYVMELLDGIDLDTLVTVHGPVAAARTVHILRQACASLSEAHRLHLVHRDIKPSNILLCRRGFAHDVVKVVDFGLVKPRHAPDDEHKLTVDNTVAGTPAFMPPEVILGEELDGRADLYALGCVAYWLLTGQTVFTANTAHAVMAAHLHQDPDPPSTRTELAVPPALDALVLACLAKSPNDRPASADDLATRLAQVPLDEMWTGEQARRWWEARGAPDGRPSGETPSHR